MTLNKKNTHFVGIGGIGMSGIALILLEMGYKISGSDLHLNNLTKKIEELGGKIFEGHKASNVSKDTGLLVYSSSVSKDNPEIKEAESRGITIVHRADLLGKLLNKKRGIAVTGTHGKTTTTSLIAVMLENSNMDPTVIIGGEVDKFSGNAKLGKGPYLVAEADESDGSFLKLKPLYSVITNIEMEHLDYYRDLDNIKAAYINFANNTKRVGKIFYNYDDANTKDIIKSFKARAESFGFSEYADIYPRNIKMNQLKTSFDCIYKGKLMGRVYLKIPGRHNVLNSLAAILVGLNLGLSFEKIVNAVKDFNGTKRRFHLRANIGDVMLIDDYAHHPTEIKAVLEACRNWKNRRIISIFQPHRYTRTLFLADDFGRSFQNTHKLILTDIYAASERPIRGVSIRNIYQKVKENGPAEVEIVKKDDVASYIMGVKRPGDIIVVMGAGDIKQVADEIAQRLKNNFYSDNIELISKMKKVVKGRILLREDLAAYTSFKIGGPADIMVEPQDTKDLRNLLVFANKHKMPVVVVGNGSNILINDIGVKGIVVRLNASYFKKIGIKGSHLTVGAGFSLPRLVKLCCEKGLGGMESLVGIPGTIGGAVYMNAGGFLNPIYRNIGEFVSWIKVMDYHGNIKYIKRDGLKFRYRCSNLTPYIILEISLQVEKGDPTTLRTRCVKFLEMKRDKQVLDVPSAGCVFKNPKSSQFTCGQMIDMLGLKGKRLGGAEISEKHANFIVNRGHASSEDVLQLIEFIRKKIMENYKIPLELEIKVI